MRAFVTNLRHIERRLRRAPLFTAVAALTLALGIGACGLMFNIVSGVLLAPLPFKTAERVVMIWGHVPQVDLGFSEQPVGGRYFRDMRANQHDFSALAAFRPKAFNLATAGAPVRLDGIEATGDFFAAIGVDPQLGHFFTAADELGANGHVVVLSDATWRNSFGGDPRIVGRIVTLDDQPFTVIGVAPRGFAFPRGAEMPGDFQFPSSAGVWVPLDPPTRGPSDLAIIGRMRAGVTLAQAENELDRWRGIEERQWPQGKGWFGLSAVPLRTQIVGHTETVLFTLLVAVGLLLLLACVNTAQLQVARLQARRRELAIRAALGASARRLAGEVVLELVALVGIAGAIGGFADWLGWKGVQAAAGGRVPRILDASFDPRAPLAAAIIAGVVAVIASAIAASATARIPLVETLKQGARGTTGGQSIRTRRWLIGAELAMSIVLVFGAGVLLRSLVQQLRAPSGFTASHALTFELTLPASKYPEVQGPTYMQHPGATALFDGALERMRQIPGVSAVAIGKPLPLSGAQEATAFIAEGRVQQANEPAPVAQYTIASSQLFKALGTPMLAGRDFDATDRLDSPPVVIVNKAMADWLWPQSSAIGKRIHLGGARTPAPWMTVVGVVADVKRFALTETPKPEMLVPYPQNPYPSFLTMQVVVRSARAPASLVPALRDAMRASDPGVPISRVRTIDDLVDETSATARLTTNLMLGFAASALILAIVGVYGLIAYSVSRRRQEFGVRRALGATPRSLLALVLREGLGLAAGGLGVGAVLAVAAGYGMRHLLYGVPVVDPLVLGAAVGVLGLATVASCAVPAWTAAKTDARVALDDN